MRRQSVVGGWRVVAASYSDAPHFGQGIVGISQVVGQSLLHVPSGFLRSQMVPDSASDRCARDRVVSCDVAGNTTDDCTLEAAFGFDVGTHYST